MILCGEPVVTLSPKQMNKEKMNSWSIKNSGPSARIVNSTVAAGFSSVGALRKQSDETLFNLRGMGKTSLNEIHAYFDLCDCIFSRKKTFENIENVLQLFWDKNECNVLSTRYGFFRQDLKASSNYYTLVKIGNEANRTRERIRQIEVTAKKKLQSKLAKVCLDPFYEFFRDYLYSLGTLASCSDLATLKNHPILGSYNPCSILLLLADYNPKSIAFYRNSFSVLSIETLYTLEKQILNYLKSLTHTVPLLDIIASLPDIPGLENPLHLKHTTETLLNHHPQVASMIDQRYFMPDQSRGLFIREVMQELPLPAHYQTITQAANKKLTPTSRKGSGFVLKALNNDPDCIRVEKGMYT